MDIAILIEQVGSGRYRARTGSPFDLSAEGATSDDARDTLARLIHEQLAGGIQLSNLSVPQPAAWIGAAKDDPHWDDFLEAMAENRRQEDAQTP